MKKIKTFMTCGLLAALFACNTLDIPPIDKINDEQVFSSEKTITAYIARLYADMPMLQFAGGNLAGGDCYGITGELLGKSPVNMGATATERWTGGSDQYGRVWDYVPIREQCYFLQELPKYADNFDEKRVNTWTAEVYFLRAFRYFEMVKRYGGVPIVDRVHNYPEESIEELTKPRNKEKECYDFILADIDKSIDLFKRGIENYKIKGRVNVWVAYALKSRIALHAASIARYGSQYPTRYINYQNGLTGIAASEATKYYTLAWDAARAVIDGNGGYSLYKGRMASGSYNDKISNFEALFYAGKIEDIPEIMFAKYHYTTGNGTAFAQNYMPAIGGAADGTWIGSPALDIVKLFEDIDGNSLKDVLPTGTDENPVYYTNRLDLFARAEPRLRASILVPGETNYREDLTPTDIRYGVLPIDTLPSANILKHVKGAVEVNKYYKPSKNSNDSVPLAGKSGNYAFGTPTGVFCRKWLDPTLTRQEMIFGTALQSPWIEIRYAEVLLNAAEAAVELNDPAKMNDAAKYVNDIRERAGAFNRNYTGATVTLDAVRNERRKEFYLENKTFWDLQRWRLLHSEISSRQWEALYPIYVWDKTAFYMKQAKVGGLSAPTVTFNELYYYQEVPSRETERNSLLIRNHQ
jgi:hypothetical protein